jgi:hypothetical protein
MTFLQFLLGPRRRSDADIAAESAAIIHRRVFPFDPVCQQTASLNRQRVFLYEERLKISSDPNATEEAIARRADAWRARVEQLKRGNEDPPPVETPAEEEPPADIARIEGARQRRVVTR